MEASTFSDPSFEQEYIYEPEQVDFETFSGLTVDNITKEKETTDKKKTQKTAKATKAQKAPKNKEPKEWTAGMRVAGKRIMEEAWKSKDAKETETTKKSLLRKINLYYKYFPHLQGKKKFTVKSAIPVLEDEIDRCAEEVATGDILQNVKDADLLFATGLEVALVRFFNVNARGLRKHSEECQELIEKELREFAVKYNSFFTTGPEWRYMMHYIRRLYFVINGGVGFNFGTMTEDETEMYKDL